MSLKQDYLALVTSQYSNSPKFKATLDLFLDQLQQTYDGYVQMDTAFDIDTAVGVQLDIIGEIEGAMRQFVLPAGEVTLGDSDYRFLIKAVIARNFCKGTRESFISVLKQILGSSILIVVVEATPMHLVLGFDRLLTSIEQAVLNAYVPRPVGVKIDGMVETDGHKAFWWANADGSYANPSFMGGWGSYWPTLITL